MKRFPAYPLQTNNECVAYAFATAIEAALEDYPPEYWRRIDRAEILRIVGAPAAIQVAAAQLTSALPWVTTWQVHYYSIDGPVVVSTWRDGIAHAVCLLGGGLEYDPGKGRVQETYGSDKVGVHIAVRVINPPVVNRWRRYALYRWLEDLLN